MAHRPQVLVIGAGILGASTALEIAQRGGVVTVLEMTAPGAGTTSTSFAWANASSKSTYSAAYFDLNYAGLRAHREYAAKASPTWFHPTGDIELASNAADAVMLETKVESLSRRGYAARMLNGTDLEALEPGIVLPIEGAAAFYADEAWIFTPDMITDVVRRASEAGARFVNATVNTLEVVGGAAKGVRLTDGRTIQADYVVTALGRWTTPFLADAGVNVPLISPDVVSSPTVGLLVTVSGRETTRIVHGPGVNWSPRPGGRSLLASNAADAHIAAERSQASVRTAAEGLVAAAAALNPHLSTLRIEAIDIGLRALPADGESICGWARPLANLYVVATHSGVTLAPILARLAASEIIDGIVEPMLESFRPTRFAPAHAVA